MALLESSPFVFLIKRVVAYKRIIRVFVFRRIIIATINIFLSNIFLKDLFNIINNILSFFFFLY
jgi:hypothetical protein